MACIKNFINTKNVFSFVLEIINNPKNKKKDYSSVVLDIILITSGIIKFACGMKYNTSCSYVIPCTDIIRRYNNI